MEKKNENKKSFWVVCLVIFLISFFILAITGIGIGYYFYKKVKEQTVEQVGNEINGFYNEAQNEQVNIREEKKQEKKDEWNVYQNKRYNYSFEYPNDWELGKQDDDHVILLDNINQATFEFRSDLMTAFGFEGYDIVDEKIIDVGGVSGTKKILTSPGGGKMIYVIFEKNGISQLAVIYYPESYINAENIFDRIVESIKF